MKEAVGAGAAASRRGAKSAPSPARGGGAGEDDLAN
jgi:hypothetical protein